MLSTRAADARPCGAPALKIIAIVRACANFFEVHQKSTYGKIANCKLYTGVAEIVFKPVNSAEASRIRSSVH